MKIIKHLRDDQYPKASVYHTRISARAICINDKGEIALTHLLKQDKFGQRNYYELPGGGKKLGETVLEAAIREAKEELGVDVTLLHKIGIIHDFYNLIEQENFSYYYLFKVISKGDAHLETREASLIDRIEWISLSKAVSIFESQLTQKGVGLLVTRRELPILIKALDFFDKH